MWKFGLNSNMVPIYSIDVLGLLTDGPPTHLLCLAPKPGLGICFGVCHLKNTGVLKGFITSENHTQGQHIKRHFTHTRKSNLLNLSA